MCGDTTFNMVTLFADSFEVTINGVLVFSKINDRKYPALRSIVEEAVKASKGEEPNYVTSRQLVTGPFAYITLFFHTLMC